ncbi:hypothetical protein P1T57_00780 [Escherichia coli]|nr:hypothetical protein [Escherichia coli]
MADNLNPSSPLPDVFYRRPATGFFAPLNSRQLSSREPRLRFTLTEVNDLPVRQTPMFTLLREAGFSSSPQGLDWG